MFTNKPSDWSTISSQLNLDVNSLDHQTLVNGGGGCGVGDGECRVMR